MMMSLRWRVVGGQGAAKETRMADQRQSGREREEAKKAARQEAMDDAIADGRLVVRQMTPQERDESDARSASVAKRRATKQGQRYPG
jgi:hypothetical protein